MIHAFQSAVSYLCFAVLAVIACVCAFASFRQVGRWLRSRLCPVSLIVFATAAIISTSVAQKRGGGDGSGTAQSPLVLSILGAETNTKWRAHGAYEDVFYLPASNWWARMPDGGWIDRLRILSSGGFQAKGASGGSWTNYPPPFVQKMSLAPEAHWSQPSLFWHATTPSNTLVVSWIGGLYARSHTNQVDFQAELFNDGSYDYRYTDRTDYFAASLPFDLDGDGLESSVDPDPLVAGADAHGTNAEWYNTVCSNILEAAATSAALPPALAWREGVNSNAYYFVDVVAERGPAPIYFTGDRESRLGNPVVVALAGVTNRVPLLIGVDYAVTSDTPFSVSFPLDYIHPTVTTNGVTDYTVRWPLNFVFTESFGESNRVYTVTVEPYDPGGGLEWSGTGGGAPMRDGTSGGCNCLSYDFHSVMFSCSSTCMCSMNCTAEGYYHLENALFLVKGGQCRCGFDDPPSDSSMPIQHDPNDTPSLTITFSKQAVIFEDAFQENVDVTMPKRSTRVRLTIDAYGGQGGGTLSLTGVNMDKLIAVDGDVALPYSKTLGSGESYHVTGVYEGAVGSDTIDDIVVQGGITPVYPYNPPSATSSITAVKVVLEAEYHASDNFCATRHTYGVGEKVHFSITPASSSAKLRVVKADASDYVTHYDTVRGGTVFLDVSEADASEMRTYICPVTGTRPNITVKFADSEYRPVMTVVEPRAVETSIAFGGTRFWLGQVGFGCLTTVNYISPGNVSFEGIAVAEIPCTEAIPPTGYYATSNYTGPLTHTDLAGAGNVISIKGLNYWCRDQAGYDNPIENWSAGVLVWKIPVGWKRLLFDGDPPSRTFECDYERHNDATSRPLLIGGRTDAYTQTYRIDAEGTASVEKFGWRLIRTRWSIAGRVEEITER